MHWTSPWVGKVSFGEYASQWLEQRSRIRPHTRESYASHLKLHLLPTFGPVPVAEISSQSVRAWHARMTASGRPGAVTLAKVYRLLRSILATAVEDGVIVKNPCVIKNAGVERSPERPVASIDGVYTIGAAIEGAQDVGGTSNGRDPFRINDMITSARKTAGESSMASGSGRIVAG